MLIEENDLRAFIKCSEYYYLGGTQEVPPKTEYMQFLYRRLILDLLQNPATDYKQSLFLHSKKLEYSLKRKNKFNFETEKAIQHAILAVHDMLEILIPDTYIPSFGPFEYLVEFKKDHLKLSVDSLLLVNPKKASSKYLSKSRTLHAVSIVPFTTLKDMESDIVSIIKMQTLGNHTPLNTKSIGAKLHLFGAGPGVDSLFYTVLEYKNDADSKEWLNYLEAPVKLFSSGYHYPVVPCQYACPFKTQCRPIRRRR